MSINNSSMNMLANSLSRLAERTSSDLKSLVEITALPCSDPLQLGIFKSHNIAFNGSGLISRFPMSRRRCFWCLPLPVFGKSSPTPGSPIHRTYLGALCRPNAALTQSEISEEAGRGTVATCRRKHATTSPYFSSTSPTTLASLTEAWARRRSSISPGKMFSPPKSTSVFRCKIQ